MVAAATLDAGRGLVRATLGVAPGAGGKHALMGTHNRLLTIASAAFPMAYLEIIAHRPATRRRPGGRAGSASTTPAC